MPCAKAPLAVRGMALIAVLWLVAAMSLVLTGVVRSVRADVRALSVQRQAVLAGAAADAAIVLALQQLRASGDELPKAIRTLDISAEPYACAVIITPLNGWVDINQATPELLEALYAHVGGVPAAQAKELAQATVDARQRKDPRGQAVGFDFGTDLLAVPGIDYGLYARVAPFVTANLRHGNGRVNPLAAPAGLLPVLTGGDAGHLADFLARRSTDPAAADASFFNPQFIEMAASNSLQFQCARDAGSDAQLVATWDVHWSPDPRSGLPWRVVDVRHQTRLRASAP
ncbi:MAG: hypothetical protein Fur007_04600 [Rhodoferax sp.]